MCADHNAESWFGQWSWVAASAVPARAELRECANLQAVEFHELKSSVDRSTAHTLDEIRDALRYAMELW